MCHHGELRRAPFILPLLIHVSHFILTVTPSPETRSRQRHTRETGFGDTDRVPRRHDSRESRDGRDSDTCERARETDLKAKPKIYTTHASHRLRE